MKKTRQDRQALLDRLERKYIKKVQLQAFRRENEQLKRSLGAMRGEDVRNLQRSESVFDDPKYGLRYT